MDQWELQVHGMLFMIWQLLYNNHLSKTQIPNSISRNLKQLEASIRYIHSSYDTEIALSDLATLSSLSEGQFCRLFKKLTGFTPFSYINRYRILKSCEYLSHSTKKVVEIATLCGFNNISYYNRVFISILKVTPSAYRKTIGSVAYDATPHSFPTETDC
jgi:AraC-like DNA-binding protein